MRANKESHSKHKPSGEAKLVQNLARRAQKAYDQSGSVDSYLVLTNIWNLEKDPTVQALIGRRLLEALNDQGIEHPELVREILAHVGTPVCTCDLKSKWHAICKFLNNSHYLSVREEALRAAQRVIDESANVETYRLELKHCADLLQSANLLVQELSTVNSDSVHRLSIKVAAGLADQIELLRQQ